jgi:hypothetical protein
MEKLAFSPREFAWRRAGRSALCPNMNRKHHFFYWSAVSCHTALVDVLQTLKASGRLMVPLVVLRFSTMKLMMLGLQ